MKILFAGGGGTGGHFYPIIAMARALRKVAEEEHIIKLQLYFAADEPFEPKLLAEENITFVKIPSGKLPRYTSVAYITSPIKMVLGIFVALWKFYFLLPDIVVSKGGYSAFPILVAARILRIPIVVHESDGVPGLVNRWAGKRADRVAISFAESAKYFKNSKIALTGNPIRHQVIGGNMDEAIETFKLEEGIPTILVLGGSQGAGVINESVLSMLVSALPHYQIIHQTGKKNFDDVVGRAGILLEKSSFKQRYHPYPFLDEGNYRNASRAASIVISRAGSGSIFEIAAWRIPAILVPLANAAQDHQRENAYAYAHFGGCEVIDEENLQPHILLSAIEKLLADPQKIERMKIAAQEFAKLDAAERIAQEVLKLGTHD